jgi:hypothetical protein
MENKKLPIDMLNGLDDNQVVEINPVVELKTNLVNYINSLISSAIEDDELLTLTKKTIYDKIPDLTFSDLKSLLVTLNSKKEILNSQLTNLLKPSQQNNSPLLDALSDVRDVNKNSYDEANGELSSKDLRDVDKVDRLMMVLDKISEKIDQNQDESEIIDE